MFRFSVVLFVVACSVPRGGLGPSDAATSDSGPDTSTDAPADDALTDGGRDAMTDGCVPTSEICNALDDDCDMAVDETRKCDTGLMGACSEGDLICTMDPTCVPAAMPGEETCEGTDEDCDGLVDETQVDCDTGLMGICAAGTQGCDGRCMETATAILELCANGVDDDCDGETDERTCEDCEARVRDGRNYVFCFPATRAVDARSSCDDFDMRLVAIEDSVEHDWILSQITELDGALARSWWIGLYDALDLERDDGGDLRSHHRWWPETAAAPAPTFENWASTEPSDDEEDCVRIREDRLWTDLNCDSRDFEFGYICEPKS